MCSNSASSSSSTPNAFINTNEDVYHIAGSESECFVEILRPSNEDQSDDVTVEAFCISVEPKVCNTLVKELSQCLPTELGFVHLKRVRRLPVPKEESNGKDDMIDSPPAKRPKTMLQVLLGTTESLPHLALKRSGERKTAQEPIPPNKERDPSSSEVMLDKILEQHGPPYTVAIPKRLPQSKQEYEEFNAIWPTQYYPLKTAEYQKQQRALSQEELMKMRQHILQASRGQTVLVVDPQQNQVVGDSNQEKLDRRGALSDSPPMENCLATPVLLAIQGISRKERQSQLQQQCDPTDNNEYQHKEFAKRQGQQYLCTGYDMYSFYEPSIFEAMACIHSRLRRLIYCRHQMVDGSHTARTHAVWTNGCTQHHIHDLPGTNHRYRVFEYRSPSNS